MFKYRITGEHPTNNEQSTDVCENSEQVQNYEHHRGPGRLKSQGQKGEVYNPSAKNEDT
jgi:hypothetical protein